MSFSDVGAEVFGLYLEGRFADALAVVSGVRDRFQSEDATLTFWEACLLSMNGRPDLALSVLQEGIDRDLWWSETMLTDSDLDAVRLLGSWGEFLHESDDRAMRAAANRPEASVRAPTATEPKGVVVNLHGAQANPAAHAGVWEAAAPGEWAVISPVGTVPATLNRWSWPLATDEAVDAVLGQLPELDWEGRVVLCGFSQGGRVALNLAAGSPSPPNGLILFAPAVRTEAPPSVPEVPTFVHVGDRDWALAGVDSLAQVMTERGTPLHVERIAGFGHAMPEDLRPILERALDWIASAQPV